MKISCPKKNFFSCFELAIWITIQVNRQTEPIKSLFNKGKLFLSTNLTFHILLFRSILTDSCIIIYCWRILVPNGWKIVLVLSCAFYYLVLCKLISIKFWNQLKTSLLPLTLVLVRSLKLKNGFLRRIKQLAMVSTVNGKISNLHLKKSK